MSVYQGVTSVVKVEDIVAELRAEPASHPERSTLRWQAALWQGVEALVGVDPFVISQQRKLPRLRRGELYVAILIIIYARACVRDCVRDCC